MEPGGYVLATAHRAGNVDVPARLEALVDLLLAIPYPVVFPVHPRTRARLRHADERLNCSLAQVRAGVLEKRHDGGSCQASRAGFS